MFILQHPYNSTGAATCQSVSLIWMVKIKTSLLVGLRLLNTGFSLVEMLGKHWPNNWELISDKNAHTPSENILYCHVSFLLENNLLLIYNWRGGGGVRGNPFTLSMEDINPPAPPSPTPSQSPPPWKKVSKMRSLTNMWTFHRRISSTAMVTILSENNLQQILHSLMGCQQQYERILSSCVYLVHRIECEIFHTKCEIKYTFACFISHSSHQYYTYPVRECSLTN